MKEIPLMKCCNLTEFYQRLQWLSDGMLENHLTHIIDYKINTVEIEQYKQYKQKISSP